MKKTVLSLALICLGLAMTACGGKRVRHQSGTEQESAVRPVINAQSSIFNTIKDDIGDVISVDFDAYPEGDGGGFYVPGGIGGYDGNDAVYVQHRQSGWRKARLLP